MKVLLVHNRYQQEGGEDRVFQVEGDLLEAQGHRVVRYVDDNDRIEDMSRAAVAAAAFWSPSSYRAIRGLVRRERPDIAHFHNTFPLISPAAYYAAGAEGVPTVQTLHNYRLLCPMAMLHRQGGICEDCVGRLVAWPGVLHACYRGSRLASGIVAATTAAHRLAGTWRNQVDRYIALTEFALRKFAAAGLPEDRLRVKPNFFEPDPGMGPGSGRYVLFAGRLVPEKGIETALAAWGALDEEIGLLVVGDGPLAGAVAEASRRDPRIRHIGWVPREEAMRLMGDALAVVVPSVSYESFPLVVVEAFATGAPVLTSDVGSLAEIVEHGRTGLCFPVGDPRGLANTVRRIAGQPVEREEMRRAARETYETRYTARANYPRLMEIYGEAAKRRGGRIALADELAPV